MTPPRLIRTTILLAVGQAAMYIESLNPHTLHTLTLLITSFNLPLILPLFIHFIVLSAFSPWEVSLAFLLLQRFQGLCSLGSGGGGNGVYLVFCWMRRAYGSFLFLNTTVRLFFRTSLSHHHQHSERKGDFCFLHLQHKYHKTKSPIPRRSVEEL